MTIPVAQTFCLILICRLDRRVLLVHSNGCSNVVNIYHNVKEYNACFMFHCCNNTIMIYFLVVNVGFEICELDFMKKQLHPNLLMF